MVWKNPKDATAYRKKWRNRNKEIIYEYLKKHPCALCGFSDIRALDFDHINPKDKKHSISELMNGTPTIKTLMEEISKCQVLCSNCHRIKTHKNKEYLNKFNTSRNGEEESQGPHKA